VIYGEKLDEAPPFSPPRQPSPCQSGWFFFFPHKKTAPCVSFPPPFGVPPPPSQSRDIFVLGPPPPPRFFFFFFLNKKKKTKLNTPLPVVWVWGGGGELVVGWGPFLFFSPFCPTGQNPQHNFLSSRISAGTNVFFSVPPRAWYFGRGGDPNFRVTPHPVFFFCGPPVGARIHSFPRFSPIFFPTQRA